MRKFILAISTALLVALLVSCIPETPPQSEQASISEVIQAIEENGWIVQDTNTPPATAQTYTIQGVVTYFFSYYAYIVDENNDGIKLYLADGDLRDVLESGSMVVATGVAYARVYGDAKEYRLYLESLDNVEVVGDGELPEAMELPDGSTLTLSEYGKLVKFDGVYIGKDGYGNYQFDNGGATVVVFKYSSMPDLTQGATYEVEGVVGQSYGYKMFVWDSSMVRPLSESGIPSGARPVEVDYVYDGDTFKDSSGNYYRVIGIDAPEIHSGNKPRGEYSEEAKEFLESFVSNHDIYVLEMGTDNYGRILAYVFGLDGGNVQFFRRGDI